MIKNRSLAFYAILALSSTSIYASDLNSPHQQRHRIYGIQNGAINLAQADDQSGTSSQSDLGTQVGMGQQGGGMGPPPQGGMGQQGGGMGPPPQGGMGQQGGGMGPPPQGGMGQQGGGMGPPPQGGMGQQGGGMGPPENQPNNQNQTNDNYENQ